MNRLSIERQTQIASLLVEGVSLRATSRLTGAAINTVMNFATDLGEACQIYQESVFHDLSCKRLQCDEIWSFVGCKEKNATEEKQADGMGDAWTWVAVDAETKLVPCWYVGPRDAKSAEIFMKELKSCLKNRVQLSTDGYKSYLTAVETAFGDEIDYGMLVKLYGELPDDKRKQFIGSTGEAIIGQPDPYHIRTGFVERQNLTMRMHMRRFTRKTNAFSKKIHNHKCAIALHFMYYNFSRIHTTLGKTPAMAADVSNHAWTTKEMVMLLN